MENKKELLKGLAVVTGASSGIGYELAKVFAQNGFDLLITAEDGGIAEAATGLNGLGGKVEYVQIDLAQKEGAARLYEKIEQLGRPVEILAVNAGVGSGGEFVKNPIEDEINMINLNITSAVQITKFVLKDMIRMGHGRILFTSSIAAEMPGPYYAVYAASKAFLQSFAQAIRFEVKDQGVTVTSLQPGATDTNFFARANMEDTKAGVDKKDDPAEVAQQGFDALMAGKDHVVAGSFMNKVQAGIGKIISEPFGAKVHSQSTKPGSGY